MYAVALTMNGKAKTELSELRARFYKYMKYDIEPHVTIMYPFTPVGNISDIHTKLSEIVEHAKPFLLVLNSVRYWEGLNNVAYVAVQNRLPVFNLHVAIIHTLQGLTTGDTTYNLQNFAAHLTITEHIPTEDLPNLKKELSVLEPKYRVRITSFTLFENEPSKKGKTWKPNQIFRFGSSE